MKAIRRNKLLNAFFYIIFLYIVVEIALRITFSVNKFSNNLFIDDDYTWRRRWVRHRFHDSTISTPPILIFDKFRGWANKPNLTNVRGWSNMLVNTNSKGIRGKEEYSYIKPKNRIRILILGDSFTFGNDVNDNETYPYYLQESLPNAEIINMGVPGYGHDQMLIYLKETGVKYDPDIVILGFVLMDMSRNLNEFRDYAKPKFILHNKNLILTNSPVEKPEEILKLDLLRPRIVDLFSIVEYKFRESTGLLNKEKNLITTSILAEIVNCCNIIHSLPIFVYIPSFGEVSNNKVKNRSSDQNFFSKCQINNEIKCLSTVPYFENAFLQGEISKNAACKHWGAIENRFIALAIKKYLMDNKYVPIIE